ncbi:MAG: peptide-methionine (S)-S-oxide reductase MsrA, partial [Pseudomonadota bacterium]
FWCLESEFRALNGVVFTISGYSGGDLDNPTYRDITTGKTGHAEVTDIYYDPDIISYRELTDFFLRKAHDPTQLNRQGVDVGTQYRSAIFYHDEEQKKIAKEAINAAEADKVWKDPIVTTLEPFQRFWAAEEYHQQYYEKYEKANGRPHIRALIKQKKKALSR